MFQKEKQYICNRKHYLMEKDDSGASCPTLSISYYLFIISPYSIFTILPFIHFISKQSIPDGLSPSIKTIG